MAIQQPITFKRTAFGPYITGNYWVITNFNWDKQMNKTNATLTLFQDSASDKPNTDTTTPPMPLLQNGIDRIQFSFDGELSRAQIYSLIKTDARFTSAIDC